MNKIFTKLDEKFAEFISELSDDNCNEFQLAVKLVSNRLKYGDICISIPEYAGKNPGEIYENIDSDVNEEFPEKSTWIKILKKNSAVGTPGEIKPLILDEKNRFYLYRYWEYEDLLAKKIISLSESKIENIDLESLRNHLNNLFQKTDEIDWQKIAAYSSIVNRFSIITGGPGTGKTSTVIKIIILLMELSDNNNFKIALTAPTGKAATRLRESILTGLESIDCSTEIKKKIPDETFTLHRLLGAIPGSTYFRYNTERSLPYDLIIVDESSMADLALMSKLFQAIKNDTRVILLGDRDQLSSVEAGSVFGDLSGRDYKNSFSKKSIQEIKKNTGEEIVEGSELNSIIGDSIVVLKKSYRFGEDSGIGELSRAVNSSNSKLAIELLNSDKYPDILFSNINNIELESILEKYISENYINLFRENFTENIFNYLSENILLSPARSGVFGVENINRMIEEILFKKRYINNKQWYSGRPIIIKRNDYYVNLFNGDTGLFLMSENEKLMANFKSLNNEIRTIPISKLPDYETVFAMTVHKSQGSEFDNIILFLPEKINRVMTSELLYTAITRTKNKIHIYGSEDVLEQMINNKILRGSGLYDKVWNI